LSDKGNGRKSYGQTLPPSLAASSSACDREYEVCANGPADNRVLM
jgi:hypothetical protein